MARVTVDPLQILTQVELLTDAIAACKAFELRKPGWMKVSMTVGE